MAILQWRLVFLIIVLYCFSKKSIELILSITSMLFSSFHIIHLICAFIVFLVLATL